MRRTTGWVYVAAVTLFLGTGDVAKADVSFAGGSSDTSGIYSTGVDDDGNLLAGGATDTHYTLVPPSSALQSGIVVLGSNISNFGWIGNTSNFPMDQHRFRRWQ